MKIQESKLLSKLLALGVLEICGKDNIIYRYKGVHFLETYESSSYGWNANTRKWEIITNLEHLEYLAKMMIESRHPWS